MDEIDQIKQKLDIVQLINEYVPLKKTGRNFKALCPFHSEKTPSFIVSPERQIWHCFGCSAGGDHFKFLMLYENMEFGEALRFLAKKAGIVLTSRAVDTSQKQLKEKLYEINHLASEYYHYLLVSHKVGRKALNYVKKRGLTLSSLDTFKIGYAPNSTSSLLKYLQHKGYKKEDIEKAGLITKNDKGEDRDFFWDRLIFTLSDHRGNVIGFAARSLDPKVKESKYINTPETPVYIKGNVLYGLDVTREAIKKENQAIVVEGEIDLITCFQNGISNVVAIKGSALTEEQVKLLTRFTKNIILSLDSDSAGDQAVRRGIAQADKQGLLIKVAVVEGGKDPAEALSQNPINFKKTLKSAIPVYDFYLTSALKKYNLQSIEDKKQMSEELLAIFSLIDNLVVQAHYLKKLAKILEVSEEILYSQMKKLPKEFGVLDTTKKVNTVVTVSSRRELLERYLLGFFLQNEPGKMIDVIIEIEPEFKTDAYKKIINSLLVFLKNQPWETKKFYQQLPSELVLAADKCYLWEIKEENKEEELAKVVKELKLLNRQEELKKLTVKMKEVKNDRELQRLTSDFQKISSQIKLLES